ncbi:hypothetical protein ACIQNU_27865 [Streptomyces sp. NPDC091292]|uniref:hypothetical protein n=1 Tax=Streptomyces sp. NPDC091292 TaxID=3365991 RepID=UPI00381FAE08
MTGYGWRGAVAAAGVTGVLLLSGTGPAGAVGAAGGPPPDPAPGGPQRPYEPDVEGPRNVDSLTAEVTAYGGEYGGGYGGGSRGVGVTFDRTSRAEPAGPPAAARRFVFLFDKALTFRPESFPTCARGTIEEGGTGACPAGSLVGRGTSHAYPEGTAEVRAYNTRHANGMRGALVVVPANGTILELTWERVTPTYQRLGYAWALDEILPATAVPPAERVGTSRFELTWGAKWGDRSFAHLNREGAGAGAGGPLRLALWSHFVTGQTELPVARTERP